MYLLQEGLVLSRYVLLGNNTMKMNIFYCVDKFTYISELLSFLE